MPEDTESQDLEQVKKCAEQLGEHFDAVHIFATRHESGEHYGTVAVQYGVGNWFTRYGQVREWIVKEEQVSRNCVE